MEVDPMKNGGRVSAEDSTTFSVTKEDVIEICNSFPSAVVTPTRREPKEKAAVEDTRGKWNCEFEFLFSGLSLAMGLGGIWRFPLVAYENGGGAFFIPYLIVAVLVAQPLYFMEMALGQFASGGCVKVWRAVPVFKGIGSAQCVASFALVTYSCSLMAISLFYLIASCQSVLPWTICDSAWADRNCYASDASGYSTTRNLSSSVEQYFARNVMHRVESMAGGVGVPDWRLVLCLFFSWVLIFLSQVKGVVVSGRLSFFTALFPYCALVVLFLRGVTLDGASQGILFFIKPQWEKLLQAKVWYEAIVQCFLSLGIGTGSIMMFSSFNRFNHNIYRDVMIISSIDVVTSFLAGVTFFAIAGNLAAKSGRAISLLVHGIGPELMFVTYPQIMGEFNVAPQVLSVVFFLMLATMGIGAVSSLTGALISTVVDSFSTVTRWVVLAVFCLVGFSIGLVYITPVGLMIVNVVDYFGGGCLILVLVILQTVVFCWIYGLKNLILDVEFMLGFKLGRYWKYTLGYFIPISLVCVFAAHYSDFNFQQFDPTLRVVGWSIVSFTVLPIPLMSIYVIYEQQADNVLQRVKNCFRPKVNWGPKDEQLYTKWLVFRETGSRWIEMKSVLVKSSANATIMDDGYHLGNVNMSLRRTIDPPATVTT